MRNLIIFINIFLFFLEFAKAESSLAKKKVFFINSYHLGLYWSDGIQKAIKDTFAKSDISIIYKSFEMDTKRNNNETYKLEIAKKVRDSIKEFKPDIIISSDDNASRYVIVPYFYNTSIPIVFCGVNGSSKKYGFPSKNIIGMEEVQLVPQLIDTLKKYTKGNRIGFLKNDSLSTRIEIKFFEEQLNKKINGKFVSNIEDWKKYYIDFQDSVDILLIGYGGGIKDWDKNIKSLEKFVKEYNKIPTATWDPRVKNIALLSFTTKPEEQGTWAAKSAIKILKGEKLKDIPITRNKEADIFINTSLAKKLNIIFPFDLIDNGVLIK